MSATAKMTLCTPWRCASARACPSGAGWLLMPHAAGRHPMSEIDGDGARTTADVQHLLARSKVGDPVGGRVAAVVDEHTLAGGHLSAHHGFDNDAAAGCVRSSSTAPNVRSAPSGMAHLRMVIHGQVQSSASTRIRWSSGSLASRMTMPARRPLVR
jgi:hypothetical protein